MSEIIDVELFFAALRISTPLILVAMGCLMCQRAGIFNIGVEGYMLISAFAAIFCVDRYGSVWAGVLGGIIAGTLMSLIFGLFVIRFKANHILSGLAINYLSLGASTFLLVPLFGTKGGYRPENMVTLPKIDIPLIDNIPIIGDILSGQVITVYVALIMVIITYLVLFRMPFGMLIRSVGQNENAVRTAGVKPEMIQLLAIIWCGVLCGIAGAHFSTGYASEFTENMTQGRGLTAFAAMIFGMAHPVFSFLACLVFGFADAIGIRFDLSNVGISPSIINMFPYVLAIVVLAISSYIQNKRRGNSQNLF